MIEKYSRDPSKQADDDIAVLEFAVLDNKILVRYHYGDENVSAATREFTKPKKKNDSKEKLLYDPSLTSGYLTGPTVEEPLSLVLFVRLEELLDREEKTVRIIREYEDEVSRYCWEQDRPCASDLETRAPPGKLKKKRLNP